MARFLVEEEGRPTRSYRVVTEAIVIGRLDTADLVLPDTGVSRKHALVERDGAGWAIVDNESANGTAVNGAAVTRAPLAHGDVVTIGKFTLTFQTDDESDVPEYTDPHAGAGDDHTSPGTPIGDLETLRSLPEPAAPPAVAPPRVVPPPVEPPAVHSATLAPGPSPAAGPPALETADGERYDIGEGLTFGKDVPVAGVLPFVSAGGVVAEGGGAKAQRGSFLIPLYVNGKSVSAQRLHDGDELRVGSSRFTYRGA